MAMGEITTIKVFMNSLELETWTIIKVGDRYFQLKILRKTL
jgi:hypothetical protein